MAMVAINNVGTVGVITDIAPHKLAPEAWSSVSNIRFVDKVAQKMLGQQAVFGTPGAAPHYLQAWNYSTEYRWIYASDTEIFYTNAAAHTNATRFTTTLGDNDYTAQSRPIWTGGVLHGVPVLNHANGTDYPQQWDNALGRFKDLDNWQANTYCKSMNVWGNFLIACNITKAAGNNPYLVKWSDVADPGTVPGSWDEADATKLAGEQPLAETGGAVLSTLPLASQNVVYKEDAIHTMQFVSGIAVFAFKEVTSTTGALNARCMAEFFKTHIVVGASDIVLFDGFKVRSIVNQKNRKAFYDSLDSVYKDQTTVTVNYATREVWINFVEVGGTSNYLTKAFIWNWEENTWSFKDLPDLSYIAFGKVTGSTTTIDSLVGTIDEQTKTFNELAALSAEAQLCARVLATQGLLQSDVGYTDRGTTYTTVLERTGLTIAGTDRHGNPTVDETKVKFVRSVYPRLNAPNPVTLKISVGAQDSPSGAVTWEGPYDYVSGTDVKVDFMISGKYLAVRFEETSDQPWEFSGYTLDLDIISEL